MHIKIQQACLIFALLIIKLFRAQNMADQGQIEIWQRLDEKDQIKLDEQHLDNSVGASSARIDGQTMLQRLLNEYQKKLNEEQILFSSYQYDQKRRMELNNYLINSAGAKRLAEEKKIDIKKKASYYTLIDFHKPIQHNHRAQLIKMIISGLSLRYLSIGQLAITRQGSTKYASCALYKDAFALMPSYLIKDVCQNKCIFEYKNASFQTNQKKKPLKILYSSQACFSILIFNQSQSIIDDLLSLAIEINAQEAKKVNRYQKDQVYAHGYLIEYALINRQLSFQSKRTTLNCPYRIIMGKQIHYDCPEKKDGMIGAALCLDEQDWIGIHYAGQNNYGYGILFIPQVIEQLINLMKTYYSYPNPKSIPTPEIYFKQDFMSTRQQTQDYQQIFEQFYDSLNSQLMETYDSLYFNI